MLEVLTIGMCRIVFENMDKFLFEKITFIPTELVNKVQMSLIIKVGHIR